MQINLVPRFLLSSLVGLLCLMPLWYYLASWLSTPVIYLAGEVCSTLFHWVVRYEHIGASGMLVTDLRVIAGHGLAQPGWLAPVADFRLHGYGMVMLWSMLLASRPARLWGKLALGTGVMWILQAVGVCIQWLNDVLNQSGPGGVGSSQSSGMGSRSGGVLLSLQSVHLYGPCPRTALVDDEPAVCSRVVERPGSSCVTSLWLGRADDRCAMGLLMGQCQRAFSFADDGPGREHVVQGGQRVGAPACKRMLKFLAWPSVAASRQPWWATCLRLLFRQRAAKLFDQRVLLT